MVPVVALGTCAAEECQQSVLSDWLEVDFDCKNRYEMHVGLLRPGGGGSARIAPGISPAVRGGPPPRAPKPKQDETESSAASLQEKAGACYHASN